MTTYCRLPFFGVVSTVFAAAVDFVALDLTALALVVVALAGVALAGETLAVADLAFLPFTGVALALAGVALAALPLVVLAFLAEGSGVFGSPTTASSTAERFVPLLKRCFNSMKIDTNHLKETSIVR